MRGSPAFALVRVLGNDLPPLHRPTQSLDNLRFLLGHEPAFPGCVKGFVLNRIVDVDRRQALRALALAAGHAVEEIEIEEGEYCRIPNAQQRGDYLTNTNGARNRAIEIGLDRADVVMPFDGQTFLTERGFAELRDAVIAHPECPAFVVPMVRLLDNAEALGPRLCRDEERGPSEPQIALARGCRERFDESIHYGRGSKLELLIRLGVPGRWDSLEGPYWARLRARPRSPLAGQARRAGFCYRLASGNELATRRVEARRDARKAGIGALVARVDAMRDRWAIT